MLKSATIFLILAALPLLRSEPQQPQPLQLIGTTPLERFSGDLHHFAVDLKGNRLFLAAEEHKSVEVFDLRTGGRIHSITGIDHPLTMIYLRDSDQLAVTDG